MTNFPKIYPLGDRAFLIEFGTEIDSETLEWILHCKEKIENSLVKEYIEVINTYNSLLISYPLAIEDIYSEYLRINELIKEANILKKRSSRLFTIPVCYGGDFGPDLKHIAVNKNLSETEIIELHSAPLYQIYFLGFLPGFLYLGGLDQKLHISRKETPRKSVEKGSVGIGGNQTGIYPKKSPGGWQLLGRSPIELFDKKNEIPSPFSAGDKIKFHSVSREEFYEIENEISQGNYKLTSEFYESGN